MDRFTRNLRSEFEEFCEQITDKINLGTFERNQEWFDTDNCECNNILDTMFKRKMSVDRACAIIERILRDRRFGMPIPAEEQRKYTESDLQKAFEAGREDDRSDYRSDTQWPEYTYDSFEDYKKQQLTK